MGRRWEPVLALAGRRAARTPDDRSARLQRLSAQVAEAAASEAPVVPAVLTQAADLLNAGYAEVMLTEGGDLQLWSLRPGRRVLGPVAMGERFLLNTEPHRGRFVRGATNSEHEFLTARGLDEAVLVPLRIDDTAGHLLVGDPVDEAGFHADGVALLETVANHAGASLRAARSIERLRFESRHDALTGLPNRLFFRDLLETAAAAAPETPVAVMVIDLNGFKAVNDSLGHAAGDELLTVLAGRFAEAVGPNAVAARLGGDEFAVLAVDIPDQQAAEILAERVTATFEQPVTLAGTRLRFGGSVGVALGPQHGTTGADLLRRADTAMYAAKTIGTAGYRIYSSGLGTDQQGAATALTLATDLREALLTGDVQIVVQPLVDLETGAVHSFEALARWDHPQLGEIAPEAFFAAAERSGLSPALSEHVLDLTLRAAREWLDQGLTTRVSVNVAPRWLADPALADRIAVALARHAVPADLLCLEFTELIAMADPEHTQQTLTALREMGVHLSVDDFGTGYSSLTYLSRLPVDQIKIDESFVQQVAVSERDRAIVRSIADLGRNLGLEVVAEGVTDGTTRRLLGELGVRFAQGYLFSPPVPASAVPALVARVGVIGWSTSSMRDDASSPTVSLAPAPPLRLPTMGPRGLALPSVAPHVDTLQRWQTTGTGSTN